MMQAMVHRGPDDDGYEELPLGDSEDGPVAGFGFRRLSILDRSPAGHQPMFNGRTGDCLVFNGEIYNFRALRAELQTQGIVFRGTSDSEVLLHALSMWGEAALERLQGMYAFAFYEARTRRILLARDPLGIKPLYVARHHNGLVFASEIRAVLASGLVDDSPDPAGIAGMLAYGAPQDPLTVHREVRSFPAACSQWLKLPEHGALSQAPPRRHWHFPTVEGRIPTSKAPETTVRELLDQAVASHLVADRPTAIFLSAGIDSCVVAAIAKRTLGDISTFTVGFEDEPTSELAAAARAAHAIGTAHSEIRLYSQMIPDLWEQWLSVNDRPSIDGFNTFIVSHGAKASGTTVALSGLGGDELFGGYPNFRKVAQYHSVMRMLRPMPTSWKRMAVELLCRGRSQAYRDRAVDIATGPVDVAMIALQLRRVLTNRQMTMLGMSSAAVGLPATYIAESPGTQNASAPDGRPSDMDVFQVVSRLECALYMGNTLLRDTDVVSMGNSIEVRVPFLDRRLVDYVMALPTSHKMLSGQPMKMLLRQASHDLLPAEVLARSKTGFSLPISRLMHGVLRDSCEFGIEAARDSGVVDPDGVSTIWQEFTSSSEHVHWIRPMVLIALGHYFRHRANDKAAARHQPPAEAPPKPQHS